MEYDENRWKIMKFLIFYNQQTCINMSEPPILIFNVFLDECKILLHHITKLWIFEGGVMI